MNVPSFATPELAEGKTLHLGIFEHRGKSPFQQPDRPPDCFYRQDR